MKISFRVLEEMENLHFEKGQVVGVMKDMRGKDFQSLAV